MQSRIVWIAISAGKIFLETIKQLQIAYMDSVTASVNFDFTGIDGEACTISNDIWVSPTGNNDNNNGTQNSPFQTITYAMGLAAQIEGDPTTIHLGPGTYEPTYECASNEILDVLKLTGIQFNYSNKISL